MSTTTLVASEIIYGSCNCGRIVVSLPRSSLPSSVTICHCSNCRKSSGSLFAVNIATSMESINIEGAAKFHVDIAASGNSVKQYFCGACGSAIMNVVAIHPEQCILKGGLFVTSGVRLPAPGREQFWRNAEHWERPFPGVTPID
ncbi:unnamed protein product [Diplocarpon coronariae]|uniref:CENP-V/GFA domain-containing protein n=1 Tax=Diplocarpon coronariae TaxID=2795749 RepID=A0A218YYA5_9HELO|nr:hypothetical protein JHW43_005276 [Diplocarpon mali]OWP00781.1 hypothetical protein B2J93_8472 [Marssonina coronariae]